MNHHQSTLKESFQGCRSTQAESNPMKPSSEEIKNNTQLRICIIGAGPSGITAAKNLKDAGFNKIVVFDRGSTVGGNWVFNAESGHSSVFETTHIISSREYSQYDDFPMPPHYPDYPSHRELAEYFQSYAQKFGLNELIQFRTAVEHCELEAHAPSSRPFWKVHTRGPDGGVRVHEFDHLVVANGHHWEPRLPHYPGRFSGELVHSHDFKKAESFRGKRVLVIGGGNSACDVAVETARVSQTTDLSWRRGYRIVPKFIFGLPGDKIYNSTVERFPFIPRKVRWWVMQKLLLLLNGPNSLYGLPEPDHDFGETHPTINSELLYFIRHGKIRPRPDIKQWDQNEVEFMDGSRASYDSIIACTGFVIRHPFFKKELIDFSEGPVPLYLRMFHPKLENLSFIGLFQPLGCIWPLAELQSKLLAQKLLGLWRLPDDIDARVEAEAKNPALRQIKTPRHTITVEYPVFRRELLDELKRAQP